MFGAGAKNCPVHPAEWAWSALVRHGGFDWLATNDALKSHHSHEPCDGAASEIEACSPQLSLDFPHAIDPEVLVEHPAYLDLHGHVASGALGDDLIIGGRGNRQRFADGLDLEHRAVFVDERNHRFSGRSSSAWVNTPRLCVKSHSPDEARGSPAPEPSFSRQRHSANLHACRCLPKPSSPIH
jgi:hypothetical protein